MRTITYTTAPAAFDWRDTEEQGIAGTTGGKQVRRVLCDDVQRDRYWSGGIYMVATEEEWSKLVDAGIAIKERAT